MSTIHVLYAKIREQMNNNVFVLDILCVDISILLYESQCNTAVSIETSACNYTLNTILKMIMH